MQQTMIYSKTYSCCKNIVKLERVGFIERLQASWSSKYYFELCSFIYKYSCPSLYVDGNIICVNFISYLLVEVLACRYGAYAIGLNVYK